MTTTLTVSVVAGKIEVTSDTGKRGGNVRVRGGRRVVWELGAGTPSFTLIFERLEDGDGAVAAGPDWPFLRVKTDPPNVADEDLCQIAGVTRAVTRLAPDFGVFKYTVKVPAAAVPVLDPVIIIDR